ncbi:MAG: recombination mediator RecR [Pseudomonadota bacterium]
MCEPIQRLIQRLGRLPGIGEKTATRLALHILRAPETVARELASAIVDVREKIGFCSTCFNLTEKDPCAICLDARRDSWLLCVVAQPADVMALEKAGLFRGRYHVLHGVLSPLDGIGPDDLRIPELLRRLGEGSRFAEVILATSPNVEGEATAMYLAKLIKPLGVEKVTRIASGIPIGGELEYVDQITLARALEARREV